MLIVDYLIQKTKNTIKIVTFFEKHPVAERHVGLADTEGGFGRKLFPHDRHNSYKRLTKNITRCYDRSGRKCPASETFKLARKLPVRQSRTEYAR